MQRSGIVKTSLMIGLLSGASALYAVDGAAYLGMQLGMSSGGSWNLTSPSGKTSYFRVSGESVGILGGYGRSVGDKFYLAGEGFLSDSVIRTANKQTDAIGTTVKMRTTYSYGVSVLPGYYITTDTILFVRAGVVRTRFELTQASPSLSSATSANTATGGQLGAGLALSLSKSLLLRGEYTYSGYQSFTAYGNKVSPHSNQLSASFVYKFV